MRLPGDEVVHLQEVEPRDAPEPRDCSICAGPSEPEEVQTLSAENSPGGRPSFSRP